VTALRVYSYADHGDLFSADGYPLAWRQIKHEVREQAGHRCVRCGHPYRVGEHGNGEWSACDGGCTHGGPLRFRLAGEDDWRTFEPGGADWMAEAMRLGMEIGYPLPKVEVTEAHWRILTVHHLTGDKADCRWWNLAALCQRCHLTIQGRVVMHREFIREHTAWFKPYAAGFYAVKYEGRDITREEAIERMDELLAYEFRQPSLL